MHERAEWLTRVERDQSHPNLRPQDAATLILLDRSGSVPKVLLGRRHERHEFLPGKFVFPGGRAETADRLMSSVSDLHPRDVDRLMQRTAGITTAKARALALAAVRETYEETGLMLGVRRANAPAGSHGPWAAFAAAHVHPDLRSIHFVARAITPPRRLRRFDTRFFVADTAAIAHRADGFVGPDAELVELVWLPITEARRLDIPSITAVVLEELQDRRAAGMSHDRPVPFYRVLHKRFVRDVL